MCVYLIKKLLTFQFYPLEIEKIDDPYQQNLYPWQSFDGYGHKKEMY